METVVNNIDILDLEIVVNDIDILDLKIVVNDIDILDLEIFSIIMPLELRFLLCQDLESIMQLR